MRSSFDLFNSKAAGLLTALDKSLAIIEFDPKGNILWANDRFCKAMGYAQSEIAGKHHSMFVEPAYAKLRIPMKPDRNSDL